MTTASLPQTGFRFVRHAAMLLALVSAPLFAGESIADSFSLEGTGRTDGGGLSGQTVQRGSVKWTAAPHYRFTSADKNGLVVPQNGAGSAQVPVPPDFRRLKIGLDVKVTADSTGWIAIGFGPAGNPRDANFKGGLFLYLNNKGGSQIRINGLKIKLASKDVSDFNAEGLNRLELTYDRATNKVSARINTIDIADAVPLPDFTPEIFFGGFSNFGTNDQSRVDNFSLEAETGWTPAPSAQANVTDAYRILFIGDSITRSRANVVPGWTIDAGMAASSPETDYVSLVCDRIAAELGRKVVRKVIADQGGKVGSYIGRTPQLRAFAPHLAIIQFGENERGTAADFEKEYGALLNDFTGLNPRPQIICTGLWAPEGRNPYVGRSAEMDAVIKKLAAARSAAYAPVARYAADPACKGYGDSHGVRWHPNDAGMNGYATEILAQWKAPAK